MKYLLAISLFFSLGIQAQPKGVISLNVLDINNKSIAKGTGFVVYDEFKAKKFILSSFHLLNINIILAEKIIDSETGKNLQIVDYDEDFDLLVLEANEYENFFMLSPNCTEDKLFVLGYYKDALKYIKVTRGKDVDIYEKGLKSIDSYLPQGFSGAPILNSNAYVCGLLVLSSEGNSNSIYVDENVLQDKIKKLKNHRINISQIRKDLGVEIEVNSLEALKELINTKTREEQKLLVINVEGLKNLNLKGVENLLIKSIHPFETLKIENSSNIYLAGLSIIKNLEVVDSNFITVTGCNFIDLQSKIDFKTSKKLLASYNSFQNSKSIFIEESSDYKFYENYATLR